MPEKSTTLIKKEEYYNILTHGFGALISVIGLLWLLVLNDQTNIEYGLVSALCFGLSLVLLYSASTLYHYASYSDSPFEKNYRLFDHICIYYLIAGSYTPFTLINMIDGNGILIFTVIWTCAFLGTIFKLVFKGKYEWLSLAIYLIMGWLILFDISGFITYSTKLTLGLIVIGGLSYTIGTYFYNKTSIAYNHTIWHIFVLLGSILHYIAVLDIYIID